MERHIIEEKINVLAVQIKFLAFVRSSLEVSVVRDCSINFCKKCLTLLIVFA